ncbi:MAG: ribosome silencing factor [bacterium]
MTESQRGRKSTPPELSSREMALAVADAARDSSAIDVTVMEMGDLVNYTDYFVIASGRSTRQAQAVSDAVLHTISSYRSKPLGVEGEREGNWILIDWGQVVIHVFYQPVREFYELEKLYAEAESIYPEEEE